MKNVTQKIVSLADYKTARQPLELADIEKFVKSQMDDLSELDRVITEHFQADHKLKETEKLRESLAEINGRILEASDWLDAEYMAESAVSKTPNFEKLRKMAGGLASRSEVTRKGLVDDMANSRYYEQRWLPDPARFISLVFVSPVGIDVFIEKFITAKHNIGLYTGESTVAVGLYLAFKNHADAAVKVVGKQIKKTPVHIRTLAVATALEISVKTKPLDKIEPNYPRDHLGARKVAIALQR